MAEAVPAVELGAAPGTGRRRRGLALVAAGAALLLGLFAAGIVLIPRYRAAHPLSPLQRSDADRVGIDDLYLDLTLATPAFLRTRHLDRFLDGRDPAKVLPVLVGVNTHTGNIEHMHHLSGQFVLVGPDGSRYPSLTSPIVLSQHHNAYMVLFPSRGNHGEVLLTQPAGRLAVEASGVGGQELRRFEWKLPIDPEADVLPARQGTIAVLVLGVALIGALLVILSPCALELTMYYSAIIACTVAESGANGAGRTPPRLERRRLLANLGAFIAGFTLLYAASGATVGLIGEGVRRPLGEYQGLFQILGGSLILLFALKVLGADALLARLGGHGRARPLRPPGAGARLLAAPGRALAGLRLRAQARATGGARLRPRDSFLVGIGLSTSCLGCMGGAVLYPLLVYAGITSWYSGLVTLGLYSLGIALPMVLIALGFFQIRLSLSRRLGVNRALRVASGLMLACVALLVLTGYERALTDLTFRALGGVSRWVG